MDAGAEVDKADDDGASAESALYWLNDEDEDMTQATLNTAASELQRANAWLTKYQNDINKEIQEFTVELQVLYYESIKGVGANAGGESIT